MSAKEGPQGSFDDLLTYHEVGKVHAFLTAINAPQDRLGNRQRLDQHGGFDRLVDVLDLDLRHGLSEGQADAQRQRFGDNSFPRAQSAGLLALLWDALSDSTILILIFAASLSLAVELLLGAHDGWVEGAAILCAVLIVSLVTAGNNFYRDLQFQALEQAASSSETATVLRGGAVQQLHPKDLVVGDVLLLNVGDCIPADCILIDRNVSVLCDESSLTGESAEVIKTHSGDCFLLSSALILQGAQCRALAIAVGTASQWGQIKTNLVSEAQATPLQEKLEVVAQRFSLLGASAAVIIYVCLAVRILLTAQSRAEILSQLLKAFILVTTVVVAAVPEGLPLAVTLTLAFCNRQLYKENCLVRTLAACETMGNVTTICTDKTGTLTENKMTVVAGLLGGQLLGRDDLARCPGSRGLRDIIAANIAVNRTAYSVKLTSSQTSSQKVAGNFTEVALLRLLELWGCAADDMQRDFFDPARDEVLPFDSFTKQSAVVLAQVPAHLLPPALSSSSSSRSPTRSPSALPTDTSPRPKLRLKLVKGAPEVVLEQCRFSLRLNGERQEMGATDRLDALRICHKMASRSLRTIALAHEFLDVEEEVGGGLCLDCILGIQDPLREETAASIAAAQRAGIKVRLMTGDSLPTALAIAADCGIVPSSARDVQGLMEESSACVAITGDRFRRLSPAELDAILPSLSVIARCSPEDKLLLVSRLSGHHLPKGEEEWTRRHAAAIAADPTISWATHRDRLLPGYAEEWHRNHPFGGEVVAVTGDGTNDAPALKAADIGLAMGCNGTKVAQAAADMVLLDDNFRSIVQAILWGRCVYDNVRKFLQFQMTANLTALLVIFVAAAAGVASPLTAVQILWLNMVMDPLGALALALEPPDPPALLTRRPYRRTAALLTKPLWRNVLAQSAALAALMLTLLFVNPHDWLSLERAACNGLAVSTDANLALRWDAVTGQFDEVLGSLGCADYSTYCPQDSMACFESTTHSVEVAYLGHTQPFIFAELQDYETSCLTCAMHDTSFQTFIFNTFLIFQMFNLWNARSLFRQDRVCSWSLPKVLQSQFLLLFAGMATCQLLLVTLGAEAAGSAALSLRGLGLSIGLGALSLLVGFLCQFVPAEESDDLFAPAPEESRLLKKPKLLGTVALPTAGSEAP